MKEFKLLIATSSSSSLEEGNNKSSSKNGINSSDLHLKFAERVLRGQTAIFNLLIFIINLLSLTAATAGKM